MFIDAVQTALTFRLIFIVLRCSPELAGARQYDLPEDHTELDCKKEG